MTSDLRRPQAPGIPGSRLPISGPWPTPPSHRPPAERPPHSVPPSGAVVLTSGGTKTSIPTVVVTAVITALVSIVGALAGNRAVTGDPTDIAVHELRAENASFREELRAQNKAMLEQIDKRIERLENRALILEIQKTQQRRATEPQE